MQTVYVGGLYGNGLFTQSAGTSSISQEFLWDTSPRPAAHTASAATACLPPPTSTSATVGSAVSLSRAARTPQPVHLLIGNGPGSSGSYALSGNGLISANNEYLGNSGSGSFTQSGGTHTVSNNLYLGYNTGSGGTYNLSGSGLLSANNEYSATRGAEVSRNRAARIRSQTTCTWATLPAAAATIISAAAVTSRLTMTTSAIQAAAVSRNRAGTTQRQLSPISATMPAVAETIASAAAACSPPPIMSTVGYNGASAALRSWAGPIQISNYLYLGDATGDAGRIP